MVVLNKSFDNITCKIIKCETLDNAYINPSNTVSKNRKFLEYICISRRNSHYTIYINEQIKMYVNLTVPRSPTIGRNI